MISVLIVDNDPLVRQGWRALLQRSEDIRVVSEGRDGQEAIELTSKYDPDVVLMDIRMPRMNGIEAIPKIRVQKRDTRVVIVSMYDEERNLRQALDRGASGFVSKGDSYVELVDAVHAVHNGQRYLSRSMAHPTRSAD